MVDLENIIEIITKTILNYGGNSAFDTFKSRS